MKPEVPGSNPGSGRGFCDEIKLAHESWLLIIQFIYYYLILSKKITATSSIRDKRFYDNYTR
jgi:hypothetical protein